MLETTTRAYTLRLAEADNPDWREKIWSTHCAVNRGVWVWGDWLLTLRGSLPADLATKDPTRRVILALSWLSVESPQSLVPDEPKDVIVALGSEEREKRNQKVIARFRAILNRLEIKNSEEWLESCRPALEARIRDDAVWVDRFACFQELAKKYRGGLSQQWATSTFFELIGGEKEYFSTPDFEGDTATEAKDFVIKAGNWLSANWGSGTKSDSSSIADNLSILAAMRSDRIVGRSGTRALTALIRGLGGEVDDDLTDIKKLEKTVGRAVGWKGRASKGRVALQKLALAKTVSKTLWDEVKEKLREEATDQSKKSESATTLDCMPRLRKEIEGRVRMPFRTSKDHIWEYAVMLDHALRRVSAAHTWIKRAEASRQKFQVEAAKMKDVPPAAHEWLDRYCDERSEMSGAVEEYLIRRNALDGWKDVVKSWKKCKDRKSRVASAREVQRNWPDSKKFGDIQLFSGFGEADSEQPVKSLADDDAVCVWHDEKGKADDSILPNYVAASNAEHDQRRFKVPTYRHPDPLRHPVWIDFGNSRWSIGYAALEAVQRSEKLCGKLAAAKTDDQRKKLEADLAAKPNVSGVILGLWNGTGIEPVSMRWESKRLRKDLALGQEKRTGPEVARADRLGRAAAGADGRPVTVANVFGENEWSGRLQANRAELDRLADLVYGKSKLGKKPPTYEAAEKDFDKAAKKRWQQLRWFLSYSAKLLPTGPWLRDVVPQLPDGWKWAKGRSGNFLRIAANEKRTGPGSLRTRLKLARLPLRVLSFDLGHRYAAACAVWGCGIPTKELDKLCALADKVVRDDRDLYRHLKYKTDKHDKKSGKIIYRTVVWRRVGPDTLAGKADHPTAWVPLERQFLIRLQGEDKPARFRHDKEWIDFLAHFQQLTGLDNPSEEKVAKGRRVDTLMSWAADEVRAALRRHGDVARIADGFQSKVKQLAGGRQYNFFAENPGITDDSPEKRAENYRRFLLDALVRWHELRKGQFRGCAWKHVAASRLWDRYIAPLLPADESVSADADDEETPVTRKVRLKSLELALLPIAEKLAMETKLRTTLAVEFVKIWQDEDIQWIGKNGHLRWLREFVMPRLGKKPKVRSPEFAAWKEKARSIRHVGGLSIDRIATILKLYQIMRAFHSRPEPEDLRSGIQRIENEASHEYRFGQRILDTLEHMRENRIKQLASRLIEAALGIGSEDRHKHWEHGTKRPRQRIADKTNDKRFLPCHAVIGEDLENYRPEQTRMRSENRRIRDWSARNVRRYIIEGCQLNGLHFDEVSPRYTSQQDSRTGAPGIRCEEMSGSQFLKTRRKMIESAKKSDRARNRFIVALAERCLTNGTDSEQLLVRLPNKSGELFVSADAKSPAANGLQADLNAAANIGLRALLDPDWPGAWWYVPVKPEDGATVPKDFPGCPLFARPLQLLGDKDESVIDEDSDVVMPTREKTNVWSDVSGEPLADRDRQWKSTPHYWNGVDLRIMKRWSKIFKLKVEFRP